MDNLSNNIIFIKKDNKKSSDKIKFGLVIFLIILFLLSIPLSYILKNILYVPSLSKEKAIDLIYSDSNFTLTLNEAISKNNLYNRNISYISSLTQNNLTKLNKDIYALNLDASINYSDFEIPTNFNVIFKYIDNNWTISDITKIKEGDLKPGQSAGTYLLNKINDDLNTNGYFEFNGIKYKFNKQTFAEIYVINEYENSTETTVSLGRFNETPYVTATLSFNYDINEWDIKSLALR